MVETARFISVIGAGMASDEQLEQARQVGMLLAQAGFAVVTGGLGGVMAAACQGAAEAGGLTMGILPGSSRREANPWCQVVLPTGLGQARNVLVVQTGLGVIAVGGGPGTLSEIGHALKIERPVVSLGSWEVAGAGQAKNPQQAVDMLLERVGDWQPNGSLFAD
ncbi:MAG: TIGR00725 family protein [Desulfarculus sp.]|nr:MAG: TIGR00725 family protein [Desulfarculus sp.]